MFKPISFIFHIKELILHIDFQISYIGVQNVLMIHDIAVCVVSLQPQAFKITYCEPINAVYLKDAATSFVNLITFTFKRMVYI